MRSAKLVLQVILALALPLNAMAVGHERMPASEVSVQDKLDLMTLKMERDELRKSISKSALSIQVLEDMAEPDLVSRYRSADYEIASVAMYTGGGAILVSSIFKITGAIGSKTFGRSLAVGSATAAAGMLQGMYSVLRDTISEESYRKTSDRFSTSSKEVRLSYYVDYQRQLIADTAKLEQVEEKLAIMQKAQ